MGRYLTQAPSSESERIVFGRGIIVAITSSQNFTVPPGVFKIRATLLAPGGGGAAGSMNTSPRTVRGGGAGGLTVGVLDVIPGQVIPVVVGSAGVGGYLSMGAAPAFVSGTDGGTSSMLSLSATGGKGGLIPGSEVGSMAPADGMAAGVGAGGHINYAGGRGGSRIIGVTAIADVVSATGGGCAPSIFGDGYQGGDITHDANAATGGGGIGGKGADTASNGSTYTAPGGPVDAGVGTTLSKLPLDEAVNWIDWAAGALIMPGLQWGASQSATAKVDLPRFWRARLYPLLSPGEAEYDGATGYGSSGVSYNAMGNAVYLKAPISTFNTGGGGGAVADASAPDGIAIVARPGGYGSGGGAAMKRLYGQGATAGNGGKAITILEM